jgi:hypothetical protein
MFPSPCSSYRQGSSITTPAADQLIGRKQAATRSIGFGGLSAPLKLLRPANCLNQNNLYGKT